MRYPKSLKKGGTIGFIAPSFGCAIEPYKTRFENAQRIFKEMGYKLYLGPNCSADCGLGISNVPSKCGEELNSAMTGNDADVIITCGGGELMCEVVPYIDFEKIKQSEPKWYMGFSDNTNYTFLSAILADTASVYGPCAPAFGREPWDESIKDALSLLSGEIDEVQGYEMWESGDFGNDEGGDGEISTEEPDPLETYHLDRKTEYRYFNGDGKAEFEGRLIGGCVDILQLHIGTKYDKVDEFLEKYKDDGFIWFLECCDYTPMSIRRAFWQMREAGWFKYVKGFLIGRPLHFGEEMMGVDQYNAVTDVIGEMGVPMVMDVDIGHLPPMMPIISGAKAKVSAKENNLKIHYIYE